MAPLPFGSSCLWGWHCLKGTSEISRKKMLLVPQWWGSYALFVVLRYRSGWEQKGAQYGEENGPMVPLFQASASSWLGKFGPSKGMRRMLWEYKERLTVGRTSVFGLIIVVDIVGPRLFLLSPSILVPFLWVSIAEGQKITMHPDAYTIRKYGFLIN